MNVFALVLAGGRGGRLSVLAAQRPKPILPFGGKYRIIDFVLSNIAHSGLERVGVLAQFHAQALMDHVGDGRAWGFRPGCLQVWLPSLERTGFDAYTGTANAVYQNRRYIVDQGCDTVLIAAGDHLYRQNYTDMLHFHHNKGAALTIATLHVPAEDVKNFGMISVDKDDKIVSFDEKPATTSSSVGSTGIYLFKTDVLLRCLEEDAARADSYHDFGRDIIPRIVAEGQAYAYPMTTDWADVGSIEAYWQFNLALLGGGGTAIPLNNPDWPILTPALPTPPTLIQPKGRVADSLLADGCIIEGDVQYSVLSPGVQVGRDAIVRGSVILGNTVIHSGAVVSGCVVDEDVEIGAGVYIGAGGDLTPNHDEPSLLNNGLTVIGKGAHVPPGIVIGRNCCLEAYVGPEDFQAGGFLQARHVPSGTTVRKG
jgi:glucose-1-phosphate adenylyltransferase